MSNAEQNGWRDIAWDGAGVYFGEIGLKGGNRRPFIRRLRNNLVRALHPLDVQVTDFFDRVLIRAEPHVIADAARRAAAVFGISHVTPLRILKLDVEVMKQEALALYRAVAQPGASFAVRARRSDKRFPLTSKQIEETVGGAVKEATGAPVNLSEPAVRLRFRVYEDSVYLEGPSLDGPGGLPLGVTGRVLTLFSGGIDSPVAAWLTMKRGCAADFLHFHVLPDVEELRQGKIAGLIRALLEPQGQTARLFLVPYHVFESSLLGVRVPPDLELVLFRRFMVRVATALAKREGHDALVTGDNLSQVASQTMANLLAFDEATDCSVFRPLLTHNKDDIIALARRIGTYELSIEPYKDCCSLVARHPNTHPKLRAVRAAEEGLAAEEMIKAALDEATVWTLP